VEACRNAVTGMDGIKVHWVHILECVSSPVCDCGGAQLDSLGESHTLAVLQGQATDVLPSIPVGAV
jgi:hypothetical protein